ncbi:MAG: transcriptional repressor [Muribaculaceae bacterium]|nr:transcriptional repressor [Muribaculaceae bacterium]
MNPEIEGILIKEGINPTPVRILVYKCLQEIEYPISLSEIEERLDSVDKSTISRTLTVFKNNHLVHSFNDGSGSVKYEICHSHDHEHLDDTHVHFRCEKCGSTICLTSVKIPKVELPTGFESKEISYIITGICSSCNR